MEWCQLEFDRLPAPSEWAVNPQSPYLHFTSNETIQGVQFGNEPEVGRVPLVCDASSDFLSRPIPFEKYGLIYACAQKNAGPAGVTIVVIRQDLLEEAPIICLVTLTITIMFRKTRCTIRHPHLECMLLAWLSVGCWTRLGASGRWIRSTSRKPTICMRYWTIRRDFIKVMHKHRADLR